MKQDKFTKGTGILGFILAFAVGMVAMRTIDASSPRSPVATAEKNSEGSSVSSRQVNPGAVRVDLHVMAQCPYGVQAEAAFKDVVAKFGNDLDLHVEYIGQNDAAAQPSSMHGPNEVKGDLYQVCAKKYAPAKAFDFILCQNENSKEVAHERRGLRRANRRPGRQDHGLRRRPGGQGPPPRLVQALAGQGRHAAARRSSSPARKYEGGRKPTDLMKAICNGADGKKPAACSDIPESPKVNVTILSDNRCGADCDTAPHRGEHPRQRGRPGHHERSTTPRPRASSSSAQIRPGRRCPPPSSTRRSTPTRTRSPPSRAASRTPASYKVLSHGRLEPGVRRRRRLQARRVQDHDAVPRRDPEEARRLRHGAVPVRREGARRDEGGHRQLQEGGRARSTSSPLHRRRRRQEPHVDARRRRGGRGRSRGVRHQALRQGPEVHGLHLVPQQEHPRHELAVVHGRLDGHRHRRHQEVLRRATRASSSSPRRSPSRRRAGIGASPTWLANNKYKFSGIDAQTIKTNLCAHNPKLAGCDATLSAARRRPSRAAQGARLRRLVAMGGAEAPPKPPRSDPPYLLPWDARRMAGASPDPHPPTCWSACGT